MVQAGEDESEDEIIATSPNDLDMSVRFGQLSFWP